MVQNRTRSDDIACGGFSAGERGSREGWLTLSRPRAILAAKRVLDVVGAGCLLLATLPVWLPIAALVMLDGGPLFFGHKRIGKDGRVFPCLKFRSMVVDAEARLRVLLENDPAARSEWAASRKLKNDPRITRIGRFLRSSSLDELPQLWNVLRGDMSLVGPRPVTSGELAEMYGAARPIYQSVRPGITGPWQISGRNDIGYHERVALDLAYIRAPSVWRDIVILFATMGAVLRRRGAY